MPTRLLADKLYNSTIYYTNSPDGTVNVIFIEDEHSNLIEIAITIGKAGSSVAAWAAVTQDFVNYLITIGAPLREILSILSEVKTGKIIQDVNGVKCASGPEAIYINFMRYNRDKTEKWLKENSFPESPLNSDNLYE